MENLAYTLSLNLKQAISRRRAKVHHRKIQTYINLFYYPINNDFAGSKVVSTNYF